MKQPVPKNHQGRVIRYSVPHSGQRRYRRREYLSSARVTYTGCVLHDAGDLRDAVSRERLVEIICWSNHKHLENCLSFAHKGLLILKGVNVRK